MKKSNKCPVCNKDTKNCECSKKICVCGHNLGYHRFVKTAKPSACLFVFNEDDLESGGDIHKEHTYCKCNKFKLRNIQKIQKNAPSGHNRSYYIPFKN